MKYYSGCSSIITHLNGTLESPAYGVTTYPPNQVNNSSSLNKPIFTLVMGDFNRYLIGITYACAFGRIKSNKDKGFFKET